jgi:prepilin-type N-terminal cleavage/methylation domain-containing protein
VNTTEVVLSTTHFTIAGAPAAEPLEPATRIRQTLVRTEGFSLIELLVVCIIISALCAIAIPLFVGQTAKATDVQGKVLARNAATTAETIATERDGSYQSVTSEEITRVEPSVSIVPSESQAYLSAVTRSASEYSLTVTAPGGDKFTIKRGSNGQVTRTCASPIRKTGCSGGESGSW